MTTSTSSSSSSPSFRGISLHVKIYIDPAKLDDFFAAMEPVFKQVTAEPECMFFEIYQSSMEPGAISWVENWSKDRDWFFANQMTKEYYKPYFAATEPLFVKPREFAFYDLLGPEWTINKA